MIEVVGDSARGEELAFVRLTVDGDRIVDADAPGLARPLAGLTLLEAAAVAGETLAADALANALGKVFPADPTPGRIAVAMSGGVDSAVALLRAGPQRDRRHPQALARSRRPRLRACVLLAGGRDRGTGDLPRARAPARHARPARGVPPRSRRPVRRAVRAWGDAEPLRALQRRLPLRRAARVRRASRRLEALDRPLRAHRRARRPAAARPGRRPREGPVVHARPARPAACSTGSSSRSASWRRPRRAPRQRPPALRSPSAARARRRASSPGTTTAPSSSAKGSSRRRRDRRRGRPRARPARRLLALHARPAPRHRRRGGRAAVRAPVRRRHEHTRRRSPRLARLHDGRGPRCSARAGRAGGREAPLPLAARCRARPGAREGFALVLERPAYGVATGQIAALYDERRRRRLRRGVVRGSAN